MPAHAYIAMEDTPGQRACAYCGSSSDLTREHLWPRALHQRLLDSSEKGESLFWLAKTGREIGGEPTIRDVCLRCNNGVLSDLDSYIVRAFDTYFSKILHRHENVVFKYDYHPLKRWLLKLCFNSSRIYAANDLFVYEPLLPYIMGRSVAAGRSVQLLCLLTYPDQISAARNETEEPEAFYYPTVNRVGFAWLNIEGRGRKLLRAVHLQSFSFFLAFFDPNEGISSQKYFAEAFAQKFPGASILRPSHESATLICDGMSAWDLIVNSRAVKFTHG